MSEVQTYLFSYKEVAEALIKRQGIHEGFWGIYMEFGLAGANINPGPEDVTVPAAIVPILKIGIHRYDKPNPLAVDAAEINPAISEKTQAPRGARNVRRKSRGRGGNVPQ
jgi:hypothetical protein